MILAYKRIYYVYCQGTNLLSPGLRTLCPKKVYEARRYYSVYVDRKLILSPSAISLEG